MIEIVPVRRIKLIQKGRREAVFLFGYNNWRVPTFGHSRHGPSWGLSNSEVIRHYGERAPPQVKRNH